MKKTLTPVLLALVALIAVTAGCQPDTASTDVEDTEIRLAPIHEVKVTYALPYYPPRVYILIKGGLTDGATTFHEAKIERSGNTINITVTTQRPVDAVATQVYGYFETSVSLGSDLTIDETYTVNVNDQTTSFKMHDIDLYR